MNKKQFIAILSTVVLVCLVILTAPKEYRMYLENGSVRRVDRASRYVDQAFLRIKWDSVAQKGLVLLLLGGVAVYSLSDNKKQFFQKGDAKSKSLPKDNLKKGKVTEEKAKEILSIPEEKPKPKPKPKPKKKAVKKKTVKKKTKKT